MDSTIEEKKAYIQENLMNKGFDSFSFTQFLCKKFQQNDLDLNKITMTEIRESVQEFINSTPLGKSIDASAPPLQKQEKKKNIFESFLGIKLNSNKDEKKQNKINEIKENNPQKPQNAQKIDKPESKIEEKNFDYGLRLPDKLKCQNVEETEISQYEDLPIKIGFPEKVEKGFLKKTVTYFTTIAVPLGKVVKRCFEDFEWLRLKLSKMFDSNFLPSLPKINPLLGIENEEETTRGLEKFMHYLSLDPIIKNSQILYDFLSIEDYDKFKKKQKEYEIITPCNDIQEFKSLTGEIDISFNPEKEEKLRLIKDFCNSNSKLLDKLNSNLSMFYSEMNGVIKRTNEIANIWGNLYNTSEKFKDDNISKEIYFQMNNFFFNLAKNFKKQNEFINIDIKESFIFMQNNYGSINELIKRIENKQRIYNKEEKDLISLKEDLFKTRNTPGHKLNNIDIDVDKKNDIGEFDLSTLLPINTQALIELKKSYGFYLNRFLKEYERMKKLNSVIYKEKITKCYKTQNIIASELCATVETLLSSMDMYYEDTPIGNQVPKPKGVKNENKDNKNENKINGKEKNNENKINVEEKKINKEENKNKSIEDSDFNIIKDDSEKK